MSTSKQQNSFPLRMPEELRTRLEARAASNGRSTNSEIVLILTNVLDSESDLANLPVEKILAEVTARLGGHLQLVVQKEAAEKHHLVVPTKAARRSR